MFRKSGMIIGTRILWPGSLDEVEQSQYFLFFVYPTPESTEGLCIIKIAIVIDRPGLTSTTSVSVLLVCGVEVNIVAENIRIKHQIQLRGFRTRALGTLFHKMNNDLMTIRQ